jgi:hypothetical protein
MLSTAPSRPASSAWRVGGLDALYNSRHAGSAVATIKQTAFRFTPEDLALLDAIHRKLGVQSRTALTPTRRARSRS